MNNQKVLYDWKDVSFIFGAASFLTLIIYMMIQM